MARLSWAKFGLSHDDSRQGEKVFTSALGAQSEDGHRL
jgi:hypothetical protein